ncbi:Tyrosine-protein kinase wzc [Pigmentiphaga humi]|uniref:Putative tyrosine-protein kinase EpsB n=1 Tax=Pigmentiphaga humi TaxID=2478468 RepID=A0A3P4B1E5_9BURK|nr:polysaccharide biosynthesis tyrosine autokinase [Pigmentiphaga humi]VCU70104.1 Tyrosine-protein kinase wzc [Pigmentiphaga humi]
MIAATPSSADRQDDGAEIRLSDLLDTLLQHAWLVCSFFFAALAIGVAYAIMATPIYYADALIQIEQKKAGMLGGVQDIADALGVSSSPVSGELEIITSREVILKAVQQLNADIRVQPKRFPLIGGWLARTYRGSEPARAWLGMGSYAWGGETLQVTEFSIPEQFYGVPYTLIATEAGYSLHGADGNVLGEGVPGAALNFSVNGHPARLSVAKLVARPGTEFAVTRDSPITAYRNILARLTVDEEGKKSSVIRVGFSHPNLAFAQSLVNAIAKAYLVQNVDRRSAEADQRLKFLEEQLPAIKRDVERAEDALNSFRTRTNTVSVEKSADVLLSQAVEMERNRLQLQLKRDELRQLYRAEHPELKVIETQIAALSEKERGINEQVNKLPQAQRDLLRLQRNAEVSNQLYIAVLNNVQQLKVAKAGTIGNVRIIDYALRDTAPVEPKKKAVVAAAILIGLALGAGAAFVARALRPTIRDVGEIERATGLVSYASVPESSVQPKLDSAKRGQGKIPSVVQGRNQLLAVLAPDDIAVESLRSLRTGLTFATLGATNKNIVITGATAGLGKSFVSANLSALLASGDKRILLVETDLRRPRLAAYFGEKSRGGLSDVLAGTVPLEQALVRDAGAVTGLDVLFAGQIPPNPGELLLSDSFGALLDQIQEEYDHILLDSAPVLPVGDTLAVGRRASTVFLVVRAEQSTKGEVKDAIRKLEASGISVKGLIFNGVKKRRVGYGSSYRYYYSYGK